MNIDEKFMSEAIKLSLKCKNGKDVPVGCVIVKNNKIIGRGYNKRNKKNNALLHAEMIAIEKACKKVHDWMLVDTTMYVTLEPCVMCTGAIIESRIPRVVYGAKSNRTGCLGSILDLSNNEKLNSKIETSSGICEEECSNLIKDFFKNLREENI